MNATPEKGEGMREEIYAYLSRLYCLSVLPEEGLSRLARVARTKVLVRGELLFNEGEEVECIYILYTGSIRLFKTSSEGRELVVKLVREGELLGCEVLFREPRHMMSAVSEEVSEVIVLPRDVFREVYLKEMGDAGVRLLESLSSCIREMVSLVEDLAFKDVEMRVLNKLYEIAISKAEGQRVFLCLTHQDIASMVGSVREVVSRTMSRLKRRGVIVDSTVKGFRVDLFRLEEAILERESSVGTIKAL